MTLPATLPNPAKSEAASGKTSRQRTWFVLYLVASTILLAIDGYTPIEQVEWLLNVPLVWIVAVACTTTQLTWAGVVASLCLVVGGILSPPGPVDRWGFLTTRAIVVLTVWLIVFQSRRRAAAEEGSAGCWWRSTNRNSRRFAESSQFALGAREFARTVGRGSRSSSTFTSIRGPISVMASAPSASQSLRAKNSTFRRQAHHEVPAT